MLRSIIRLIEYVFGIDDEPIDHEKIESVFYETNQYLYFIHFCNPEDLLL